MGDRNESRRMTSIARRINISFWFKRLGAVIMTDILIAVLICISYIVWCEKKAGNEVYASFLSIGVEENDEIKNRFFEHPESLTELSYVIEYENGEKYTFYPYEDLYIVIPAISIFILLQLVYLFFSLFGTGSIRRKLRPLNDLAIRAEELSNMSFDYSEYNASKFEQLEHAIENVSPNSPDAKIVTGDSDLRSIEIALNNLLRHMRESQMQQARFVSDASHELRTPIAVIQGYVNMLDRWGKEDESVLEESIEALKNESEHMKELVEQLLFLARGDSGRNTINKVVVNLSDLMYEVWEESVMIDEAHIYEFVPPDNSAECMINGDVAMIKQSARIFIQNAAKYSPEKGKIKIKVKCDSDKVSYVIQDEGIGMSKDDVTHIFERFYRSDKARNGETGGSGLGLSIAKWIVDAHDGVIDVISGTELGSRFTVSFEKYINYDSDR